MQDDAQREDEDAHRQSNPSHDTIQKQNYLTLQQELFIHKSFQFECARTDFVYKIPLPENSKGYCLLVDPTGRYCSAPAGFCRPINHLVTPPYTSSEHHYFTSARCTSHLTRPSIVRRFNVTSQFVKGDNPYHPSITPPHNHKSFTDTRLYTSSMYSIYPQTDLHRYICHHAIYCGISTPVCHNRTKGKSRSICG